MLPAAGADRRKTSMDGTRISAPATRKSPTGGSGFPSTITADVEARASDIGSSEMFGAFKLFPRARGNRLPPAAGPEKQRVGRTVVEHSGPAKTPPAFVIIRIGTDIPLRPRNNGFKPRPDNGPANWPQRRILRWSSTYGPYSANGRGKSRGINETKASGIAGRHNSSSAGFRGQD